jgi:hypothetical protein
MYILAQWAKFLMFTIGRAAREACSAMWNLGTNSAFALGPRKTTENLDWVGRLQDLPDANWLLASSLALNPWALTLVPICAVVFCFLFCFSLVVQCCIGSAYTTQKTLRSTDPLLWKCGYRVIAWQLPPPLVLVWLTISKSVREICNCYPFYWWIC